MSKSPSHEQQEVNDASTSISRESNGTTAMDDPKDTMATVTHFIDKLHANVSSTHEKELITARVLGLAKWRKEVRTAIGSHAQAMPLFISILKEGTPGAKVNVAATLSAMCKDDDFRVKVLIGGCIPSLVSLLKSESVEAKKAAAEALYEVSFPGISDDHVGQKIFITEGVVPTLWDQLNQKNKQDKVLQGFLTGALRNLCVDKDNYWKVTLESGGVDILVGLLLSESATVQFNAASLLARVTSAFGDSIAKVIDAGAIKTLLHLMNPKHDICIRISAADALEVLSYKSVQARKLLIDADGERILIGAIVAPSKECTQGKSAQALWVHTTRILANIHGGMPNLLLYLGELSQSPRLAAPVVDILGALAYALMVFEQSAGVDEEQLSAIKIENILVKLLKPRDDHLIQERILESMARLYGNICLSRWIYHAEAKKVLTGLARMSSGDSRESLITSLISLCRDGIDIWEAVGKREGIHLLIPFLGLSSDQLQEYVVWLLSILSEQVDDSKWAITAAGGVPPLVKLVETGCPKVRQDAACVLWNLCCHNEDISACVKSAGAVSAFLLLLKKDEPKGQEIAAMALIKLIQTADSVIITQLVALLLGDSPGSKTQIIRVLGHSLSIYSCPDLMQRGSAANTALKSLIEVLQSSNEETQDHAAITLTDLLSTRQDICECLGINEISRPSKMLLNGESAKALATQLAQALSALSQPLNKKATKNMPYITDGDVKPLILLAKTSSIDAAETTVAALADLLLDPQIAAKALTEDVVTSLIRVLVEGSPKGKKHASRALYQLLKHFSVGNVLPSIIKCRLVLRAIVDSVDLSYMEASDIIDALEVVCLLTKAKQVEDLNYSLSAILVEVPSSLEPLVLCLAEGPTILQDKVIEILSSLCGDQSAIIGDLLVAKSKAIGSLANRIINSSSLEVRVGGTALLICVSKEYKQQSMNALLESGYLNPLIYALVEMIKHNSSFSSLEIEVRTPRTYVERSPFLGVDEFDVMNPATVLGDTVALWFLSIVSSSYPKSKLIIMKAGGLEALSDKLLSYFSSSQVEFQDTEGKWISSLLLSILFQDANVVSAPATMKIIPSLACLLKSEEVIDKYFASQAIASLVCSGSKEICLTIVNSGAIAGLVASIGYVESNMPNLFALSEEFCLMKNPHKVIIEHLIKIEEAKVGSLDLLVAVLLLGSRDARYIAAVGLCKLLDANKTRDSELAWQAIQPLIDMLNSKSDGEQEAALTSLVKLTFGSTSKAALFTNVEGDPLQSVYKLLISGSSLEVKRNAAELCFILFSNAKFRENPIAAECGEALILLMKSNMNSVVESSVCAFDRLLGNEKQVDLALATDAIVNILVGFVNGRNYRLIEGSISALIKLGKDRAPYKLEMVKAGIIDKCLELFPVAPKSLCYTIAELFRILTNSGVIARSADAAKLLKPLFSILNQADFGLLGQQSALQALVNILEKQQNLSTVELAPYHIVEPLISFLKSPSQASQQLGTELFSHLLTLEHFRKDVATKNAILPLVRLAGIDILNLQQPAINSLEKISTIWPKEVADAGGIVELAKVVIQDDPLPPLELWETATSILSNILRFNVEYYFQVPLEALVKMLQSTVDNTIKMALNTLMVHERKKASSAEQMAEIGVIDCLLDLLISHKCEELSGRLLEALFNHVEVREMKVSKYAIAPLAKYLVDPQTLSDTCKLLVALSLGDLSQQEGIARASDSISACRALLSILKNQPSEEMTMVAICALQNFVMHSRTNRKAVAEAGGIKIAQELLMSSSDDVARQATILIKYMFSNHTLQEHASNELIRSLTALLERELWSRATMVVQVWKTLNAIFTNFPKLRVSEATILCIPYMVNALKSDNEAAQESALDTICLLRHSWSSMPMDIAKSQAMLAAEAIPILQRLLTTCPPSFYNRVDHLLHCLPGCLIVTVKRGNNLRQSVETTNAFCRLKIGHGPSKKTKALSHNASPEWNESFAWAFDVPPLGQKLHIICENKTKFGKATIGRVAIQINEVVTKGVYGGIFSLKHEGNEDGSSRSLEIEINWRNRTSE